MAYYVLKYTAADLGGRGAGGPAPPYRNPRKHVGMLKNSASVSRGTFGSEARTIMCPFKDLYGAISDLNFVFSGRSPL